MSDFLNQDKLSMFRKKHTNLRKYLQRHMKEFPLALTEILCPLKIGYGSNSKFIGFGYVSTHDQVTDPIVGIVNNVRLYLKPVGALIIRLRYEQIISSLVTHSICPKQRFIYWGTIKMNQLLKKGTGPKKFNFRKKFLTRNKIIYIETLFISGQNTTNLLCLPQCKSNEFLNSNEPINVVLIKLIIKLFFLSLAKSFLSLAKSWLQKKFLVVNRSIIDKIKT
ncbi:hypothetical protein BpHYR1_049006 [Brachionus plicatilis]|uniref:Uncharacterized protein n=1 Tax=Brachionus plicatilis TaxID=10195 RepID=A0A3M7T6Z8_BRAPC|nr:hypothetical protein BpHYR1_049006 [Brachionus plicatilis]